MFEAFYHCTSSDFQLQAIVSASCGQSLSLSVNQICTTRLTCLGEQKMTTATLFLLGASSTVVIWVFSACGKAKTGKRRCIIRTAACVSNATLLPGADSVADNMIVVFLISIERQLLRKPSCEKLLFIVLHLLLSCHACVWTGVCTCVCPCILQAFITSKEWASP